MTDSLTDIVTTSLGRFRFGLRTLFVVVTVVSMWLAYAANWIRSRNDMRAKEDGWLLFVNDGKVRAPSGLWLLGEVGESYIVADPPFNRNEVARLFPEAYVSPGRYAPKPEFSVETIVVPITPRGEIK